MFYSFVLNWKIPFIIGIILIVGINSFFYFQNPFEIAEQDVEYFWDFGDGASAVGESPEHVYESAGKYKVTVKIRNGTSIEVKTFVVDATPGMKYQGELIPIQIEGFSTPE